MILDNYSFSFSMRRISMNASVNHPSRQSNNDRLVVLNTLSPRTIQEWKISLSFPQVKFSLNRIDCLCVMLAISYAQCLSIEISNQIISPLFFFLSFKVLTLRLAVNDLNQPNDMNWLNFLETSTVNNWIDLRKIH